jgi:putative SOS response-associated peptidase YedK
MCGRFTNGANPAAVAEAYGVALPGDWRPRFNIAPGQSMLSVRRTRDGADEATLVRFGLIPSWAKERSVGYKMINARAETLRERPAYRSLLAKGRCLILADGFYEWRVGADGKKEPLRFSLVDREVFAFAGLWTRWTDRHSGDVVESAAIITTGPNELVAPVHDRMPVILDDQAEEDWLEPDASVAHALSLLTPYPSGWMSAQLASRDVNSVRNDHAALLVA